MFPLETVLREIKMLHLQASVTQTAPLGRPASILGAILFPPPSCGTQVTLPFLKPDVTGERGSPPKLIVREGSILTGL